MCSSRQLGKLEGVVVLFLLRRTPRSTRFSHSSVRVERVVRKPEIVSLEIFFPSFFFDDTFFNFFLMRASALESRGSQTRRQMGRWKNL